MLSSYDRQLLQRVFAQDAAIGGVFNQFVQSISGKLTRLKEGGWAKNPTIEKEIDQELERLQSNLSTVLKNNQKWAFALSKAKNDELVKSYIRGMSIASHLKDKLFGVNMSALEAFMNRKVNGMDLSGRVWNICNNTKDQLGFYLESGIATGRSAQGISQDIRKLLNNPDAVFRMVQDENGNLKPSKPMKDYHPGQGVYRSARQNAIRLSATETNMAYRMADHNRWQSLDFIVGYEVKLSGSHPATDICDYMKGVYPKDFIFRGWHSRCFCHAEPILMPEDEYIRYMDADEETAKSILEKHSIENIPFSASSFIEKNKSIILGYKNPPYWVADNFKDGKITNGIRLGTVKIDTLFTVDNDIKKVN